MHDSLASDPLTMMWYSSWPLMGSETIFLTEPRGSFSVRSATGGTHTHCQCHLNSLYTISELQHHYMYLEVPNTFSANPELLLLQSEVQSDLGAMFVEHPRDGIGRKRFLHK